jgi:polyhydroxyalkanoate synthase
MDTIQSEIERFMESVNRGVELLRGDIDCEVATTPADVIYREDKMRLLHYRSDLPESTIHRPPVLIIYALINRYIMLDLQPGRSFIQNLLKGGMDVYLIDWGYPTGVDRFLNTDDYINYYIDTAVELIRTRSGQDKINMMGVCMGGTFGVIYTALHAAKIKNLVTLATPTNFDVDEAVLFLWAKKLDVEKAYQVLGNLPGDIANFLYLLCVPVATVDKYLRFLDGLDNPGFVGTFLRMEKWIFDSPDMPAEVFREYFGELLQKNLLIQNRLVVGAERVDLTNITCPVLNMYGKNDYLVPPSAAKPLVDAVGSEDVASMAVDTCHVGIFVGSTSHKTICPQILKWIKSR